MDANYFADGEKNFTFDFQFQLGLEHAPTTPLIIVALNVRKTTSLSVSI